MEIMEPLPPSLSFAVSLSQTITFTAIPGTVVASSGLAVTLNSTTTSVCTTDGSTVTLVGTGNCSITASQAGGTNGNLTYLAANDATLNFTVNEESSPTPINAVDLIPNQILGVSPFPIAASAASNLPVTFSSSPSTVCTNAANLITLVGTGMCTITASQAGNESISQSFTVSQAGAGTSFAATAQSPLNVGKSPESVAVADFNNDGFPDLAVVNSADGTVSILLGDGTGNFSPATGSPVRVAAGTGGAVTTAANYPVYVVTGDFNGDGNQDFAVANGNSSTVLGYSVYVMLGNGSGGFTAGPGSPYAAGANPLGIAVGDFNGDGIEDLVVANYGPSFFNTAIHTESVGNTLSVLLGAGAGSFQTGTYVSGYLEFPFSVAVGNFGSDANQDLAVANSYNNSSTVETGNGSGSFSASSASQYPSSGDGPVSVKMVDFNGDGYEDFALVNLEGPTGPGGVTIMLNNAGAGFTAQPLIATGSSPRQLVIADFNGDGYPDIAVANRGSNNVTVLLNNCQGTPGTFCAASYSPITVSTSPYAIAAADVNGDGVEDIIVVNQVGSTSTGSITVLLGKTN